MDLIIKIADQKNVSHRYIDVPFLPNVGEYIVIYEDDKCYNNKQYYVVVNKVFDYSYKTVTLEVKKKEPDKVEKSGTISQCQNPNTATNNTANYPEIYWAQRVCSHTYNGKSLLQDVSLFNGIGICRACGKSVSIMDIIRR